MKIIMNDHQQSAIPIKDHIFTFVVKHVEYLFQNSAACFLIFFTL